MGQKKLDDMMDIVQESNGGLQGGLTTSDARQLIRDGLEPFLHAAESTDQQFLAYLISMAIEEAKRPLPGAKSD